MSARITVVGGGAWGTTLADLVARKGNTVTLWAREAEVVETVNHEHVNAMFLPGAALDHRVVATDDLPAAVRGAEVIVSAVPSHALRAVMQSAAECVTGRPLVVSVSKGLEPERLQLLSRVLEEVFAGNGKGTGVGSRIAVLSGPSFAREVYERQPTAVVAAAREHDVAQDVQRVFSTSAFRVYSHTDVVGVELGGALKNVIAIATGIIEGLGLGYNPRAALITRGLAELTRLGVALGADPMTFAGLAGLGDLVLTATGPLSRNRSLGVELGRGRRLEEIQAERKTVAEGVQTAKSATALGDREGVELPIAREVNEILFRGKPPRTAVQELMERELKREQWR